MNNNYPIRLEPVADALAAGTTYSRQLVEECLGRADDTGGEGKNVFRVVNRDAILEAAAQVDRQRKSGSTLPRYAGIPISIKDLFDVAGEKTLAGSRVLADRPDSTADAPAVAKLRAAGFLFIGRSNMTEFAYSGLGLNPHYGTPRNPWDRQTGRIPGGSSSGAAVSVTDGMAVAALGTDTGGSCRIPAAMCGITGFKPTQRRVSLDGVSPLSSSLDSVGPLAASASCCAALDAILAGDETEAETVGKLSTLRIGVLRNYVFTDIEDEVANRFEAAVGALSAAGVGVSDITIDVLDELPAINSKGGFPASEAYAWHKSLLESSAAGYDPRVSVRIAVGARQSAADYIELLQHRRRVIDVANAQTADFDAVIYPTIPIVAPTFSELENDDDYARINLLALRNPTVTNFLDRCAVSIPIGNGSDAAPVGMNIMGHAMQDRKILALAEQFEALVGAAN